jgi:hypothetical protein
MHGFLGFRRLGPLPLEYFSGVERALERAGFPAYAPTANPLATTAVRAHEWFYGQKATSNGDGVLRPRALGPGQHPPLGEIFLRHGRPLHLIAHSQGCLDARYLVSDQGLGLARPFDAPDYPASLRRLRVRDCIGALVTVAGPHNGVRYADGNPADLGLMDALAGAGFNRIMTALCGRPTAGRAALGEFGREAMLAFNRLHRDPPGVRLYSVAGLTHPEQVTFFLQSFYRALSLDARFEAEDSDGLVPLSSARWPVCDPAELPRGLGLGAARHGRWSFLGAVYADHVEQIGLPFAFPKNPVFRPAEFYLGLARLMAGELPEDAWLRLDGRFA